MVPLRGVASPARVFLNLYGWRKFMAKQFVRLALCAALALCGGSLWAGGETENKGGPMVKTTRTEKGRESKIHVYLPTDEAKLYFDDT